MRNGNYEMSDVLKTKDDQLHPDLAKLKKELKAADRDLKEFHKRNNNPNGHFLHPYFDPPELIAEQDRLLALSGKANDKIWEYLDNKPSAVLNPATSRNNQTAPKPPAQAASSSVQAATSRNNRTAPKPPPPAQAVTSRNNRAAASSSVQAATSRNDRTAAASSSAQAATRREKTRKTRKWIPKVFGKKH